MRRFAGRSGVNRLATAPRVNPFLVSLGGLAVRGVSKGALRTHSAWQAPLWVGMGLVTCRVLFARSPVLGLCFFVSVRR